MSNFWESDCQGRRGTHEKYTDTVMRRYACNYCDEVPSGNCAYCGCYLEFAYAMCEVCDDEVDTICSGQGVRKRQREVFMFLGMIGVAVQAGQYASEATAKAYDTVKDCLPTCSGNWFSGSGGHRAHDPFCDRLSTWWIEGDGFSYCDEHIRPFERGTKAGYPRAPWADPIPGMELIEQPQPLRRANLAGGAFRVGTDSALHEGKPGIDGDWFETSDSEVARDLARWLYRAALWIDYKNRGGK